MKLLRYGPTGAEQPGLLDSQGRIRSLAGVVGDLRAESLGSAALAALARHPVEALPLVPGSPRLGTPYTGVGKFIAIGLNYSDHAAESGLPVPTEPVIFMKATSCTKPG